MDSIDHAEIRVSIEIVHSVTAGIAHPARTAVFSARFAPRCS